MADLSKDLKAMAKELKALTVKLEKLQKQAEKSDKPAKTKAPAKKPSSKKASKKRVTAASTVLTLINRRKKGVDVKTIKKVTEFDTKKISNILFKLKKEGC